MERALKGNYFAEDLTQKKLIDDGSLYVYQSILAGRYSFTDPMGTFTAYILSVPLEWNNLDIVKFIIAVINKYDLKISYINVISNAISDDYVIDMPKELKKAKESGSELHTNKFEFKGNKIVTTYQGAYAWAQNYIEDKNPFDPQLQRVIKGLFTNTATIDDILFTIEHSKYWEGNILTPKNKNVDKYLYAQELFKKLLEFISIHIDLKSEGLDKMKKDVEQYMEWFIQDTLKKESYRKSLGNTNVKTNPNVFTFEKHKEIFLEKMKQEFSKFGNEFVIEDTFDEPFESERISEEELRARYKKKEFLFFHTIFALNRLNLIKILSLGSNWDYHEDYPVSYEARIRLLPSLLTQFGSKSEQYAIRFDTNKSRLYFKDKEIKIKKFSDQYHILRIMFENPKDLADEWFFSLVAEKYDSSGHFSDKKFYNAIYQINLKLGRLGIDDLFITTRQSVKINEKYMS